MAFFKKNTETERTCLLQKLLTCLIVLCNVHFADAEMISLASKGKSFYQIVYPASASLTEKFAAAELKKYLVQISQAKFNASNHITAHSIVVCTTSSLQKMGSGPDIPSLKELEYGIFKRGESLWLTGGSDASTLHAVYDFLSALGCRWLAPDFNFYEGKSKSIPVQTELSFLFSGDRIGKPVLKYRKLYIEEGLSHHTENLKELIDWMPKARFNVLAIPLDYQGKGRVKWDNWRDQLVPELQKRGIIIEVGGHGYQNFLNASMDNGQLYKKHPEWFGLKNGNRSPDLHVVFCTSNADAVAYLQNKFLNYLKARPEINIFDFWPPDGETWCECPDCLSLGSATDRHALLVSQTAEFLKKELPKVRLECLAYSRYVELPQHVVLNQEVLLDFCPINQSFEYQIYDENSENNRMYKENLLSWLQRFKGDISIYSYYRKYAWHSLPNVIPHYIQNDLRFYRDCGVKGISVYAEPGDWFTYGLNHYVLGHLAWDPDADINNLITDYCVGIYGPTAKIAASVYDELEQIVRFGCKIPHTKQKSEEQYNEYLARLKTCADQVTDAICQYAADEILCRHLHRLKLMIEYARQSVALMKSTVENNKQNIAKVTENIRKLMHENVDAGVFILR